MIEVERKERRIVVVNDRTFHRNGVLNDEVVQEVEVVAAR